MLWFKSAFDEKQDFANTKGTSPALYLINFGMPAVLNVAQIPAHMSDTLGAVNSDEDSPLHTISAQL